MSCISSQSCCCCCKISNYDNCPLCCPSCPLSYPPPRSFFHSHFRSRECPETCFNLFLESGSTARLSAKDRTKETELISRYQSFQASRSEAIGKVLCNIPKTLICRTNRNEASSSLLTRPQAHPQASQPFNSHACMHAINAPYASSIIPAELFITLCPLTTNPVITSLTSGDKALALAAPLRISPSSSSSIPTSIARLKLSDLFSLLTGPLLGREDDRGGRSALPAIWCSFRNWIFFARSSRLASRPMTGLFPSGPLRTRIFWLGFRLRLTVRATPTSPPTTTGAGFTTAITVTTFGRPMPIRCRLLVAASLAWGLVTSLRRDSSDALRARREGFDRG